MTRYRNREENIDPKTNNQGVNQDAPKARDVAEFKGVDKVRVLQDLSLDETTEVIDPHPDLVYRPVRPANKAKYEAMGYRDNPPNRHGEPARTRGPTPDLVLMAVHRDIYEARQGAKRQKLHEMRQHVSPRRDAFDESHIEHVERVGGGDIKIYGPEVRSETEVLKAPQSEEE